MSEAKREYHHGRTPAAWAGSIIVAVGFLLAAVGAITGPMWALVIAGALIVLVGTIAGGILRGIGYGQ